MLLNKGNPPSPEPIHMVEPYSTPLLPLLETLPALPSGLCSALPACLSCVSPTGPGRLQAQAGSYR
eukprot:scaffold581910_cov42-Prasinocladus_malaysianus.AAC.1